MPCFQRTNTAFLLSGDLQFANTNSKFAVVNHHEDPENLRLTSLLPAACEAACEFLKKEDMGAKVRVVGAKHLRIDGGVINQAQAFRSILVEDFGVEYPDLDILETARADIGSCLEAISQLINKATHKDIYRRWLVVSFQHFIKLSMLSYDLDHYGMHNLIQPIPAEIFPLIMGTPGYKEQLIETLGGPESMATRLHMPALERQAEILVRDWQCRRKAFSQLNSR